QQPVQLLHEPGLESCRVSREDAVERILVARELTLAAVAERHGGVVDERTGAARRDDDVLDRARRGHALEARLRREALEHLRRLLAVELLAAASSLDACELAHERHRHGGRERGKRGERAHEYATTNEKVAH